jgi:UV DNA damage endonuclease
MRAPSGIRPAQQGSSNGTEGRATMGGRRAQQRRLGFAVKVLGRAGLPSHDTRRWQSEPTLGVSIEALHAILDYLRDQEIRMYRMSSDFVPYATHPDMPQFYRQIDDHAEELSRVGRRASEMDIRLSLHPSQYVVLNAQDPSIASKAAADLRSQARLLDAMEQGPEAVMVLHIGGTYGDKRQALDRFLARFERLPEPARRRLTIENDEISFTVQDCLWVHERTDVPVIFDHQHHRLNPGGMTTREAAQAALSTWPPRVVPKIHFSSARLDGREVGRGKKAQYRAPLLRQHADFVDPWTFADFLDPLRDRVFDVMLEAKAKDLALLKLCADLRRLGRIHVLQNPPRPAEPPRPRPTRNPP